MKPIETIYNGYRFRSRLEARWAVFFDTLGVQYEYEPEGFRLDNGMLYLPDFRVQCWGNRGQVWGKPYDLWIEVKGYITDEDKSKLKSFANAEIPSGMCGMEYVENPLLVLGEIPPDPIAPERYFSDIELHDIAPFSYQLIDGDQWVAMPAAQNGKFFLWGADESQMRNETEVLSAYGAARRARFEHGETPRVKRDYTFH